jgi:hypothetical protein
VQAVLLEALNAAGGVRAALQAQGAAGAAAGMDVDGVAPEGSVPPGGDAA